MELSDISDFEDIMITSSNEDMPMLEASPILKELWFALEHYKLTINYHDKKFCL